MIPFNIQKYPLVSDQVQYDEVAVILRELDRVVNRAHLPADAAAVEFGCYTGTTSLFITRYLEQTSAPLRLHVYDSFAGLPEKTTADYSAAGEQFKQGELLATKQALVRNFKHAGLRLPVIHKGWFDQLNVDDVPGPIAFAFLDGDYYDSIMVSLRLIEPKLMPGAVVIVDDYQTAALPGATKAVDTWLSSHPHWSVRHEHSLAVLKTQG